MNCKKARILCQELLDERLNERAKEALHAHLVSCPACRSFYEETKKLKKLVASLPTPQLNPSFNSLVSGEIARRERAKPRPFPSSQLAKRVALFLLPLLLFFLLFNLHIEKQREEELFNAYRKAHFFYTSQNPLISGDAAVKMLLISGQE